MNGIAADGSAQVAVGSANGFPATWFSADAGTTWSRGTGAAATVLNRPGLQQLSGVVHGNAGWVAVGGVQSAAASAPSSLPPPMAGPGRPRTGPPSSRAPASSRSPRRRAGTAMSSSGGGPSPAVDRRRLVVRGPVRLAARHGRHGRRAGRDRYLAADARGRRAPGRLPRRRLGRQSPRRLDLPGWPDLACGDPQPAGQRSPAQLQQVTVNGRRIVAARHVGDHGRPDGPVHRALGERGRHLDRPCCRPPAGLPRSPRSRRPAPGSPPPGRSAPSATRTSSSGRPPTGSTGRRPPRRSASLGGQGVQEITALTVSGRTLTGVGFAASPASETPTIWRSHPQLPPAGRGAGLAG